MSWWVQVGVFLQLAVVAAAACAQQDNLRPQAVTVQGPHVRIQGYRYLNSEGKPNTGPWVVFLHGLGSNLHEFEYVIPQFVRRGYDCYAFNFRGHGNGAEQSTVETYHEGDYELKNMAEIDLPQILNFIRQSNSKEGFIFGHSMGGMVPRGAFSVPGADMSQVKAMILLGSPPHFRTLASLRRHLDPFGFVARIESFVLAGSGADRIDVGKAMSNGQRMMDLFNLFNPAYWIARGVFQWLSSGLLKNGFGASTLSEYQWMERSVTGQMPKDILRSFTRFSRDGYPYESVKIPVPILHIMGANDLLVRSQDISEHAKYQSEDGGHWLIQMAKVGHLGLVAPRVAEAYEPYVFRFMRDPDSLGPANQTWIDLSPLSVACGPLLMSIFQ